MFNIWARETKAVIRIENCIDNCKILMILKITQFTKTLPNFVIWTYVQAFDFWFLLFQILYCKPVFMINYKSIFASGDWTITA